MKLAIISDIHYGPLHQSTNHPGYIRQDSEQALTALEETITHLNQLDIDAFLQLGDLIIPENHDADLTRIGRILIELTKSKAPVYSLLGNHDLDNLNLDDYQNLVKKFPLNQGMVGNFSIDDWDFWWLNHRHNHTRDYLADSEMNQIKKNHSNTTHRCILTHYPLIAPDITDSFYFDSHPQKAKLANENLELLWKNQPTLLLNGHLHFYSHISHGHIHAITQAPFSENLQTKEYASNHPHTYTILEIQDDQCQFSTYCGGFTLIRDVFDLAG
jgi:DNA repair exonuclease SbcCD nuclease subunit